MADAFKKVQPGDKLRIPAAAYNAFIDTAIDLRKRQHVAGQGSESEQRNAGIVLVRNNSGEDLVRLSVLGIDDPVIEPDDSLQQFKNKVALDCSKPQESHRGRFVILLDSIPNGQMGRAYISGVGPAYLHVEDEDRDNRFADVRADHSDTLETCGVGAAQVLWRAGGQGTQWALVRLGNPPAPGTMIAVQVQMDGGAAGSKITPCSFTYTVTDASGGSLGTLMTPEKARPPFGALVAGTGTGVGYYKADGNFVLYDANETLDTEAC